MIVGTVFTAAAFGYSYQWEITSELSNDVFGRPYIVAKPIKRLAGKSGTLRAAAVWHLETLKKQKFNQGLLPIEI